MLSPPKTACCSGLKVPPRRVFPHTHHTYVISTVKVSRQGRNTPPPRTLSRPAKRLVSSTSNSPRAIFIVVLLRPQVKKLLAKPARVLFGFIFIFSHAHQKLIRQRRKELFGLLAKTLENTLHHSHKRWFTLCCHPPTSWKNLKTKNKKKMSPGVRLLWLS